MNAQFDRGTTRPARSPQQGHTRPTELDAPADGESETPLPHSDADTDGMWSDPFSRGSSPFVFDLSSDALEETRLQQPQVLEGYRARDVWAFRPGYFDAGPLPMRSVSAMPPILASYAAGRATYEQAPQIESHKALYEPFVLHGAAPVPMDTTQDARTPTPGCAQPSTRVKRSREIESAEVPAEPEIVVPIAKRARLDLKTEAT